ncbi:hypothetical protein E2I00_007294 [Balaenoptera physalus]|uniref:Uncharacterized protein n=1 Tax=Balaenoptera physalus TaxID=9770 RepID=A0A6A1Q5Y7_BALPH|nr:hypothetical protein E2I00_007294 [Balaenoptera physalus]
MSPSRDPWPTVGRPRLTFEETIAGGNAATHCSPGGPPRNNKGGARKRQLAADIHGDRPLPPTPKVKRSRLEAARRLNFRSDEMEELLPPDSPTQDITPPPSPEVPAELWGKGPLDTGADVGLTRASPAARNPVLRRPPVLEDYINVTSTGGDRAFLVLRADPVGTGVQSPLLDIRWRGRGQLDLLGVSFASLKEKIDSERRQQLLEEAQRLSDTLCRSEEVEEGPQPSGAPEEEPADSQDASQHCLWVDEFAPQRYTELLSDDFTNRCLLKWLKLWDLVVFGRERPTRKPRPSVELARGGKEATASSKWKSHGQVLEEMLEAELDPSGRPRQKGLFDNFLRLRLRDSSLAAVCIALDWLAFDDLLGRAAHHGQSFQLLRYLPFLPPAFHLLFASSHVPRITFPSSQQEVRPTPCPYPGSNPGPLGDLVLVRPPPQAQNRMSRTHNLIQTLVSGITPATRSRAAPQALILDTLCLLLDILAPKLRPVDGGPLGGTGEKGAQPSAPCSHEQRLECILKRAALEEQPERDFFGRVVVKRAAAPSTGVWGGGGS